MNQKGKKFKSSLKSKKKINTGKKNTTPKNIIIPTGLEPTESSEWHNTIIELVSDIFNKSKIPKHTKSEYEKSWLTTSYPIKITSLILHLVSLEYDYLEYIRKFQKNKNISGQFLKLTYSTNKYHLNIQTIENLSNALIKIIETYIEDLEFFEIFRKKPRLSMRDNSLQAYLKVIELYLENDAYSENKACKIVFNKFDEEGKMKKSTDFQSFKVSFRDWYNDKFNRLYYREIGDYLTEKERRHKSKNEKSII